MSKLKIAAQLYTLRDYCRTPEGVLSSLTKIKEMGYDGVEIEGIYKIIDAEIVAEHLNKIGLEVCATRSPLTRTELDLEGMIKEAKLFNCKNVGIGPITFVYAFSGTEGWSNFLYYINNITKKLAEAGLKVNYCHDVHEFVRLSNGRLGFDILVEGTQPKDFYFMLDSYWLVKAGLTMDEYVKKLAGRVDLMRFRDQKITENYIYFFRAKREPCEVGEGLFDFKSLIPIVKDAGASWISLGQEFCTKDPFESLKISLENVKQIM